jgi:hypothetical protein
MKFPTKADLLSWFKNHPVVVLLGGLFFCGTVGELVHGYSFLAGLLERLLIAGLDIDFTKSTVQIKPWFTVISFGACDLLPEI